MVVSSNKSAGLSHGFTILSFSPSTMISKSILSFTVFLFLLSATTAAQTFRIFEKPVVFDDNRKTLSLDYLKTHYHIETNIASIKPVMIVLHWTAIPTLEASYDVMNPAALGGMRKDISAASNLNVAAQFLIDRDGTIFRQLPDTAFARHVIGLNYCAIGIENVGSDLEPLTEQQLKANEELVRYLTKKYPIQYLIGHYEYKLFINTPLWKETDPGYLTEKTDPGISFMQKIRMRTQDLHLKGTP